MDGVMLRLIVRAVGLGRRGIWAKAGGSPVCRNTRFVNDAVDFQRLQRILGQSCQRGH